MEKTKELKDNKPVKVNLLINFILLALFAIYTPFSPVAVNMNIHVDWVDLYEPPTDQELLEEEELSGSEKRLKILSLVAVKIS